MFSKTPRTRSALISLIVAMTLLTACAVGGPLEGEPRDLAAPPAPPPVVEATIPASDGTALTLKRWGAETPKAVLLALHGYGDYGESTFARAAPFWASRGITVLAYDQRGFGRNTSRGKWPGADGLIADARRAIRHLRQEHPALPFFLLGHSMGGGVALAASTGLEADGLILAAPAIWGGSELNPLHRLAAWTAAAWLPERRFTGRGVVRIQASDNIEMLRALGQDPYYLRPPSAREIFGLVRVVDRAAEAAPSVDLPALLLLGDKDQIIPHAAVSRVFARLKGEKETIRYPEGWHLLFRDLQAERVWRDVADWIDARLAASS